MLQRDLQLCGTVEVERWEVGLVGSFANDCISTVNQTSEV